MINWLKKLFCRHHWQEGSTDGTETFYWCRKCGKEENRKLSDLY